MVAGCNSSKIPEGVTEITDNAFYYTRDIDVLEVPHSVNKIGKNSFATNIYTLYLNKPNVTIVNNAFISTTTVYYNGTVQQFTNTGWGKSRFNNNNEQSVTIHCTDGDLTL